MTGNAMNYGTTSTSRTSPRTVNYHGFNSHASPDISPELRMENRLKLLEMTPV